MEQTIVTLVIAAGGAVFGVLAIAGAYLAARAAMRDANGALHKVPAPEAPAYGARSETLRRSGSKPEHFDPVRVQQALIVELHRTRSILLGWLSVLEAFALGDAWRATALRAELGDINTCDITLVGDANVIATYQLTVDMLRNQAGRGLPPDVASQMASIRVRLLTALAEQERRLNHGEQPQIAEPLGHLDLWGPPRPITELVMRPSTSAGTSPPDLDDTASSPPEPEAPPEPLPVYRPVTIGGPAQSSVSSGNGLVPVAEVAQLPERVRQAAVPALITGPIGVPASSTGEPGAASPRRAAARSTSKASRSKPGEPTPSVPPVAANPAASKPAADQVPMKASATRAAAARSVVPVPVAPSRAVTRPSRSKAVAADPEKTAPPSQAVPRSAAAKPAPPVPVASSPAIAASPRTTARTDRAGTTIPVQAATTRPTAVTRTATTKPAAAIEAATTKPAALIEAAPTAPPPASPASATTAPRPIQVDATRATRPAPAVPATRPTPIAVAKPAAQGQRPATQAIGTIGEPAAPAHQALGGKASTRPTSKRSVP